MKPRIGAQTAVSALKQIAALLVALLVLGALVLLALDVVGLALVIWRAL